jgi:hypothetical protein
VPLPPPPPLLLLPPAPSRSAAVGASDKSFSETPRRSAATPPVSTSTPLADGAADGAVEDGAAALLLPPPPPNQPPDFFAAGAAAVDGAPNVRNLIFSRAMPRSGGAKCVHLPCVNSNIVASKSGLPCLCQSSRRSLVVFGRGGGSVGTPMRSSTLFFFITFSAPPLTSVRLADDAPRCGGQEISLAPPAAELVASSTFALGVRPSFTTRVRAAGTSLSAGLSGLSHVTSSVAVFQ